jgi:hypothetical protein
VNYNSTKILFKNSKIILKAAGIMSQPEISFSKKQSNRVKKYIHNLLMHKKVQVFPKYRPQEIKRRTNLKK